jgi:hypothetical protein
MLGGFLIADINLNGTLKASHLLLAEDRAETAIVGADPWNGSLLPDLVIG